MNWLSLVLAAILALLTWRAYRNGFVRELVSLGAAVVAIPVAGVFYDDMVPKVQPIVDNDTLARLVSFIAIFAGVVVGGQVAAHLLKQAVNLLNLGAADHVAGAIFGFVKAYIICQVILIALVAFPSPDLTDAIDESSVAAFLLDSAPPVLAVLPDRFDTQISRFLSGLPSSGLLAPTATATPVATPTPAR